MKIPSDPVRLRALAKPGTVLERGLDAARSTGPTDEQLAALERSVLAAVGTAAGVAAVVAAKPASSLASSTASWLSAGTTKLVLAMATVAAVGGGALLARHTEHAHRQTPTRAAQPAPVAKPALTPSMAGPQPAQVLPAPLPASLPSPEPSAPVANPVAKKRASKPGPRTAAQPSAGADEEMLLLRRATQALTGAPAQALAMTDEHRRRFPDGVMDQERELIAIRALVALGRSEEARQRGERFAHSHAGSVYRQQIEAAIGKRP